MIDSTVGKRVVVWTFLQINLLDERCYWSENLLLAASHVGGCILENCGRVVVTPVLIGHLLSANRCYRSFLDGRIYQTSDLSKNKKNRCHMKPSINTNDSYS